MKKVLQFVARRSSRRNKVTNQLFRGILGREPSNLEAIQLSSQLVRHGNLEAIARDLVTSEEFSVQVLPQLVSKWTQNYTGRRLFFLHVPKTAGSSIRLALTDALGIPPVQAYRGFIQPSSGSGFWPFWVGHAAIAKFPSELPGITFFREPRARLLSSFRQRLFEIRRTPARIPLDESLKRPAQKPALAPADIWSRRQLWRWFHLDHLGRIEGPESWTTRDVYKSLSPKERVEGLKRGLSRIQWAGWTHDEQGLLQAVGDATGKTVSSLPRENTLEWHSPQLEPIELSKADMDALERTAEADNLVIDIAVKLGLIPRLDSKTADKIFLNTAERHKFILP